MSLSHEIDRILALANKTLFEIAGTPINLTTLVTFALIILLTLWSARFLERSVMRVFIGRGSVEQGSAAASSRLIYYAALVTGFGIAVQSVGINLTALFAAGAVFAVAVGFAMQNIAQNFVSGVILLLERTIKPGDILEVDGRLVQVREMGIRATVARTQDEEDLIIPNARLVSESVKNFTLRDSLFRLRCTVGVVYSSDMELVKRTLEETAAAFPGRAEFQPPRVMMLEFADSAVVFEVSIWIDSPWDRQPMRSKLNEAIWWALKKVEVTIAFPQLDVHLDPPIADSLERLSKTA